MGGECHSPRKCMLVESMSRSQKYAVVAVVTMTAQTIANNKNPNAVW